MLVSSEYLDVRLTSTCRKKNERTWIRNPKSAYKFAYKFAFGYPNDAKGYKFYNHATKKMLLSHDALFMEDTFYKGWSEDAKKVQNKKLLDEGLQLMKDVYFNDEEMAAVDQDAQVGHQRKAENVNYQPEVIPRRSGRRVVESDHLVAITGD